jgi:hypothetical protein
LSHATLPQAFKPGNPGGPGRPKGIPNKLAMQTKEMFLLAADGIGGLDRLIEWIKADPTNERIFWSQMMTKMLPHELTGAGGGALALTIVRDFSGDTADQVSPEA